MKIKTFTYLGKVELEYAINTFAKTVKVKDVKYSVFVEGNRTYFSAMIIYRDKFASRIRRYLRGAI